ncbi:hypothetical protein AGABI1DRAFT_129498 [Agaricus bisporus var. burnettii JB137-S8]|uniref:Uncharacterized protein n=1 Tax=Agaricus bisporus var. burnettii (strain JB137-S8 / ATCC MYA-4627 / FGSC 10392) TaxID=597362 RepID=K5X5B4_AGABU|nr:uncharacterized protein AGABI1DRAFT_129498 [Agaricus bisporus var. burnettii JB137-S8]EKM78383.1 hypothetical protein AGABI1DRAFT_129498 [Agaricus bisporus var. burnettii JB137-S8]
MSDRKATRYFDKSTSLVRDTFSQFEQQYARPAYSNMHVYFRERPITSTFVTVFTLLSLIPVAFFAGIASFIFATFTLAALFLAVAASSIVILACFAFLLCVLIGAFLLSLFLTGAALSSYALVRLAHHVQREGPSAGVSEWKKETKSAFMRSRPTTQDAADQGKKEPVLTIKPKDEYENEDGDQEGLPASLYEVDDQSDMTLRKEDEEDEEDVKGKGNMDARDFATDIKDEEDGEMRRAHQ